MSRLNVREATPGQLVEAARSGDRRALGRILSLVERGGDQAREVAALVHSDQTSTITVGITGAPGAGKSTLTAQLVSVLRSTGDKVAVLAVDPSSPFSGGAILGDRIRMGDHVLDDGVFIRSMATRGHLGGLALATPGSVRVLSAMGFDWVLIETVGVGQVEVEVAGAADTTVVVVNPGWGDAIQANKAGLMEIADIFVVNKADRDGSSDTIRDLEQMMDLGQSRHWRPPICSTVGTTGDGVEGFADELFAHRDLLKSSGELDQRRGQRWSEELRQILLEQLTQKAAELLEEASYSDSNLKQSDPWTAADKILNQL